MTTTALQKRNAYFAWASVCLIWGTTYLGIKIALETVPPKNAAYSPVQATASR